MQSIEPHVIIRKNTEKEKTAMEKAVDSIFGKDSTEESAEAVLLESPAVSRNLIHKNRVPYVVKGVNPKNGIAYFYCMVESVSKHKLKRIKKAYPFARVSYVVVDRDLNVLHQDIL